MYQSIYYDRTDYTYYLRDDKHGWKENFKYNPTRYQLDPDGELKNIFGQSVSVAQRAKFRDPNLHFHDMKPHQKFLVERYGVNDVPSKGHREVFFDIECEIGGALTEEYGSL